MRVDITSVLRKQGENKISHVSLQVFWNANACEVLMIECLYYVETYACFLTLEVEITVVLLSIPHW